MSPIATDRILMTPCRFWGNADIEQFSARNNLPDSTLTGNLAATPNGDIGSDQQPHIAYAGAAMCSTTGKRAYRTETENR
jgi:hypothetical protein